MPDTPPTPLQRLLDLDAGRLPRLAVRIDGRELPVRPPETLPLADALRLGELLQTLADETTTPQRFDAAALAIVQLVAPALTPASRQQRPLLRGQARRLAAFYAAHLARSAEALSTTPNGGAPNRDATPLPFATPSAPVVGAPASP